jgi:TRAP-type C4-dicarboxylate transport system substrate-binding protein
MSMVGQQRLIVCAVLAAVVAPVVAAGPVEIKLATFAPVNSAWHLALTDMGNAWARTTEGRVRLKVYAGGTQGPEPAVIKLMSPAVDQLQAALLLQPGLASIDQSFNIFAVPFLLDSEAEFVHVLQKITPVLADRLERKGFHLVNWGHAGWIQLFSKKPMRTLDDLKRAKLYTSAGDVAWVQWYKTNGFNPQPLSLDELPAQLKLPTGRIDTTPGPPYAALSLQIFRDAPYMLEVRVAPLISATIVALGTWNAISPEDRARVTTAARVMEQAVIARAPSLDLESIAEMQKRGLKVEKLTPAASADFRQAADRLMKTMRGTMVPADVFDLALRERDAFRGAGR